MEDAEAMRFQFTLQTLLLSAVVIWSSMAAFGPWGLVLAVVILSVVACVRASESMLRDAAVVCLMILCGLCLFGLLLPAVRSAREAARRVRCQSSLKQLALALHDYHDDYGCFPPAFTADANGKPVHSWRVLILPYLGEDALYEQYHNSEPWDGPNNRKLGSTPVPAYVCLSSENWASGSAMTNYVAVVGPKTAWPGAKTIRLADVGDGTSNTIVLVEVSNSDINWMEPRDLSFDEALRGINPKKGRGISSPHVQDKGYFYHNPAVVNVAFADGNVHSAPEGLSLKTLEALLTIDGGETIHIGELDAERLNWTNCLALAALVVSSLLLLLRPRKRAEETKGEPPAA